MTESKFTKGPWHKDKWGTIYGSDNRPVLLEGVYLAGTHTEETAANRDLFLAAPELYEALKLAFDSIMRYDPRDPVLFHLNAAIQKAEGRS